MITRQAARMRLSVVDRSRAQTLVAEHTTLARLAATMDPASDAARDALLAAAHYDQLTISLLAVLAEADAQSTGPGVWTPRVKQAQKLIVARALEALKPRVLDRPAVHVPLFSEGVALKVDWEDQEVSVSWCGTSQGELKRIFALLSALGWTIVRANIVREEDGAYKAEFFLSLIHI